MRYKSFIFVLILIVITLILSAEEKIQTTKTEDIKKLLEVTKAIDAGIQGMNDMLEIFKSGDFGLPDKFYDEMKKEITIENFSEVIIPIYDKCYTHDDIKELLVFYETPLGIKLIRTQPIILNESKIAAEKWATRITETIINNLQLE